MIAPIIGAVLNPTIAQQAIISSIIEKKVILVLREVFSQTCTLSEEEGPTGNWDTDYPEQKDDIFTLLNGVTDDVDITYYFWTKDGDFRANFDRETIFDYAMIAGTYGWNLLPIVPDKVYYSSSKAPALDKNYPDGETPRSTNAVAVTRVSDAVIGIDAVTGVPFIASDAITLFGLDENGVAYAAASSLDSIRGGYAYAVNSLTDAIACAAHPVLYTFGYNLPDNDMSGGAKLLANVVNVDDPDDARSKDNLGWNLLADVADINLPATYYVDYAITFDEGDFDSWIRAATNLDLSDFEELTNDYSGDDASVTSSGDYFRGKGYFVHTAADLPEQPMPIQ